LTLTSLVLSDLQVNLILTLTPAISQTSDLSSNSITLKKSLKVFNLCLIVGCARERDGGSKSGKSRGR